MLAVSFPLSLSLDILFTLIHVFGIWLTAARLYSQKLTKRLWWDDYAIAISAAFDLGYIPLIWLTYAPVGSIVNSPTSLMARHVLGLQFGFVAIWSSRISIALTIARIFAPGDPIRTFAITMSFLFLFFFVSLSTLYTIICYSKMHLTDDETSAFCHWKWTTRISISAAALLTDALAFGTPLYCLLQVRLPKKQRRLVVAGFIGSALMALTSIAFTILLYGPHTWDPARLTLMSKSGNFQIGISLVACNLAVVLSILYNARRNLNDTNRAASRSNATTLSLTQVTIDHTSYFDSHQQWQSFNDTQSAEAGITTLPPIHTP